MDTSQLMNSTLDFALFYIDASQNWSPPGIRVTRGSSTPYTSKICSTKNLGFFENFITPSPIPFIGKGRIKASPKPTSMVDENDHALNSDKEIATSFGGYFANVFSQWKQCAVPVAPNNEPPDLERSDSFPDLFIHPWHALRTMKKLKSTSSATYDGIPQVVFRRCCHALQYPIAFILNAPLLYGEWLSPRGSSFPLLFLLYTAGLPEFLKVHPRVEIKMFADDIRIYCAYSSNEQVEAHQSLSLSIQKMLDWSDKWELPINLSKTIHLHLGPCPSIPFRISGVSIRSERSVNDLGITVDDSLTFNSHISMVAKKALTSLFR
ncbi:hypothetical protein OSTOST_00750, partial [Ostertagia ostertagi]